MPERDDLMGILEEKRWQIQKSLERLYEIRKEYMEGMDESSTNDESDLAQREISLANVYSLIERKTQELRQVEYLMSRLETDQDFGICEECGGEIPFERLLAMPGTTLCVDCQADYERQGRMSRETAEGIWTKDYEGMDWGEEGEDELGVRETSLSSDTQGEGP